MTVPYEEWSRELKAKYAYDPELAERLLDEAGYPRGADGVRFRVKYTVHHNLDLSFAELQAAYWAEIGVQVDVVNTPQAQVSALLGNGPDGTAKYDMVSWLGGVKADPMIAIMGWPAGWCYGPDCEGNPAIASAEYDALYERARLGATLDEVAPLVKQMDMMIIENVWALWGPIDPLFNVQWPWVKGYTNEGDLGGAQRHVQFVRMWIDQELKSAMGF
jgi:peptide/nickel transport system substrate-binding protein